jgi:glycosyltransferase involved in cell wall biosynthesis
VKISVVIPAFNEENLLPLCLGALQKQTVAPFEIIVIDNNSTDGTRACAEHFGARVVEEPSQGIYAAAVCGYNAARGDIIARIDADTRLPSNWIERLQHRLSDDSVGAVTGPGEFYDGAQWARQAAQVCYMKAYFWSVGTALGQPPLFGSNCAFRTNLWRQVKQEVHQDETLFDDIDLSFHVALHAKIHYDPGLKVGISIRPLRSLRGMLARFARGMRTIMVHWPEQAPWKRLAA